MIIEKTIRPSLHSNQTRPLCGWIIQIGHNLDLSGHGIRNEIGDLAPPADGSSLSPRLFDEFLDLSA